MKKKHYVLLVVDDVEPQLYGPYACTDVCDKNARALKARYRNTSGIFALDISSKGVPTVSAYSAGFFMEENKCDKI